MKPSQKPVKVHEKDTVEEKESKLQYYVRDHNDTKKLFEKFVRSKYGFTKGIIGQEVLEALEDRMALHGYGPFKNRSIDYIAGNGPAHKKLKKNHEILLRYLEAQYKEGDVIKFKDIQDIIRRELNRSSRRTHKSYVDVLRSRELLIQPDGVQDYDYYFFKEMPQAREGRPAYVVDVQTRLVFPGNKLYDLLPGSGNVFTVQRLRKMTTMKDADFQAGLKQLTELKIIRNVGIGQFIVEEEV